ncbi:MAG: PCP reductase family protein [Deltaproteobacteria bacterium]|nr:PCP reductase family protein [Deltaproteobacteria bacterium]
MVPGAGAPGAESGVTWTASALRRLERIPEFVRPMARGGIERFARERGLSEVDEAVLDEAKSFFGM